MIVANLELPPVVIESDLTRATQMEVRAYNVLNSFKGSTREKRDSYFFRFR
jgi:hypothetical protein